MIEFKTEPAEVPLSVEEAKPISSAQRELILTDICLERIRQEAKWGEQNHHPFKWMTILGEEVGETCKEAFELDADMSAARILKMREEAIQVAAVAVAFIECLDRGTWTG